MVVRDSKENNMNMLARSTLAVAIYGAKSICLRIGHAIHECVIFSKRSALAEAHYALYGHVHRSWDLEGGALRWELSLHSCRQ